MFVVGRSAVAAGGGLPSFSPFSSSLERDSTGIWAAMHLFGVLVWMSKLSFPAVTFHAQKLLMRRFSLFGCGFRSFRSSRKATVYSLAAEAFARLWIVLPCHPSVG